MIDEGPKPSLDSVKAIYDKAYANPGLMGTHLDYEYSKVTKSTLLKMCSPSINNRLLDVGTGDGDLWEFVSPDWLKHAVDISHVGLQRTKTRFPVVYGVVSIAENLPYPDEYFGAIVAADTIEHVFNIETALREIKRVLAPGGRFALSVPTPNSLPRWAYNRFIGQRPSPVLFAKLVWTIVQRTWLFGRPTFQPIDRDISLENWQQLLIQAGFAIETAVSWPEPPLKPIVYLIGLQKRE